jgi:hypothetical protein
MICYIRIRGSRRISNIYTEDGNCVVDTSTCFRRPKPSYLYIKHQQRELSTINGFGHIVCAHMNVQFVVVVKLTFVALTVH